MSASPTSTRMPLASPAARRSRTRRPPTTGRSCPLRAPAARACAAILPTTVLRASTSPRWRQHRSPTQTFVRRLPVPSPTHESATNEGIPPFSWTPVQGAISYDVHVEQADGTTKDFNFESPSFTVAKYYGIGIVHLQVRAAFPTGTGGTVAGGYSALQPVL